jgi:hypothetical protein
VVRSAGRAAAAGSGTSVVVLPALAGENRVDAELLAGPDGPGVWRFEALAAGALEPGSLRALAGEVVEVGPEAITFRISGKPGERVAFAFRVRSQRP